ncbi:MAG: aspartate/glutamate racemase family protein [Rubrivivax sp.]|nr:aspartate/glutamate racemase family protein [Rubrivivax sp.]
MLQTRFPRPPGDIGHPATFGFEVRRRVVQGASPARVVRAEPPGASAGPEEAAWLQPFITAGEELVAQGARALGTSCGFLAGWQRELQAALPVPVWTSALLKLAELRGTRCGVITIEAASLSAAHFLAVDADPQTPVEGITPGSALHATLLQDLPTLDEDDACRQVVAAGQRLVARHRDLQALVLECTNLPPYARALQQAVGLPVHDIVSLLNERMAGLDGAAASAR